MNISATDIAAWWGAAVATVVLIWDIIKWRLAGPRLRLTVQPGMKSVNMPEYEGRLLITFQVSNFGTQSTTIRNVSFHYYRNCWNRLWNRSEKNLSIMNPTLRQRIPYELRPGNSWDGVAIQTNELESMARDGYLICAVYHSHTLRPTKRRILITAKAR